MLQLQLGPSPAPSAKPSTLAPRARLNAFGAASLTDAELLSVLLRGRELRDPTTAARVGNSGLAGLIGAAISNESSELQAAIELAVRLARTGLPDKEPIGHPACAARYLYLRYARADQEIFGSLFLDARQRLIEAQELFVGTQQRAAVEPRAILARALTVGAAGVLVFHTHPSGDPSASAEDLVFTRRLDQACETVGIRLVDHLILGDVNRWVSLRERGGW